MNTIQFGELNSYEDLKLILNPKTITTPPIKTMTTNIPGGDGVLDYTEYFGKINYNNRKLSFDFSTVVNQNEFPILFSYIQNTLHGKTMRVYLSDDPGFYYFGRVTINEFKSDKRVGKLTIDVDAEPYKYKDSITTILATVTTTTNIVCTNLRKEVVPKITVDKETSIVFGGQPPKVLSAGEWIDDDIIFVEGLNTLTVTPTSGSVNIKIEYQERGL